MKLSIAIGTFLVVGKWLAAFVNVYASSVSF
jgi:hypothetical protein